MVRLILAVVFASGGFLVSLSGLYLGYWYFILNDRILLIQPEKAKPAALTQLVAGSRLFDQQWVSVKGRLWRVKGAEGLLVPESAGTEHLTGEALQRWLAERDSKGTVTGSTLRALPKTALKVDASGFGLAKNVSLRTTKVVTLLGRYHRGALGGPSLHVGAILEQARDKPGRLSAILFAALAFVIFIFGCTSIYAGIRMLLRGKPKTYFDEPELR